MSVYSKVMAAGGLLLAASGIAAQTRDACSAAAGAAFGITGINCPACTIKYNDGKASFTFFAEPVVLETVPNSPFIVGDIVEAVHGRPITTEFGAAEFTHPPAGPNEVTVRRGRDRKVIPVTVAAEAGGCVRQPRFGFSPGPRDGPFLIVDGTVVSGSLPFDNSATGGFGIGVACAETCTSAFGTEGVTRFTYYKYSSLPAIIGVRPGGPADRAGIKVGDVIEKVDGVSILEDAGALKLWSVFRKDSIRLTIIRDGKSSEYLIKVR